MKWKTRLTDLLGCKYPIMLGGLTGIGTWEFAAAVSNAGADGCLTAAASGTPEQLREDIKKLRDATSNHFTINVTIGMCPQTDEMLDVCIEEKVPAIETAAFKPDQYARKLRESDVTWIHKGATLEFVKHAEKLGVDAIVLVGLEGYGFKNIRQLPTMTSIAWAADQIKVPLIAAGGIGDSRTMLAALAAGADGVYMGSALMATVECPIHERIKENMVAAKPDHPDLIRELIAPPRPEDFAEIMAARDNMPLEKWLPALEKVMLKHHDWQEAKPMWEQDLADVTSLGKRPKGPFSFACAYTNSVVTVKEFIDNMVGEAEEIMERLAKQWELGGGGGQDGEHKPAHRYGNEGIAVQDPTVNEVTQSKPVSSEDAVAAEKLNIEGNDLGRSGNFSQAEIKYTAAIALDSKYQEPWYNRGKARLNLRKYKAAISDFDRALTLSSDPKVIADIFNNRGIAKKKLGDVEGAILDYGKALKQNPALYRVYVNRGIAYYELGKKAQAIGDFRIARDHGEERAAEALRQLGAK